MSSFTIETDFGRALRHEIDEYERRTGQRQQSTRLLEFVAEALDVSRNTVGKYLRYQDVPTKPGEKLQVTALLFALGVDPQKYGLSADDLAPGVRERLSGWFTAVRGRAA